VTYRVGFTPQAGAEFDALERPLQSRILRAVTRLAENPFAAANVKALAGGGYRLRVGDYRVLYRIEADTVLVLVLKIGHRREVYRLR